MVSQRSHNQGGPPRDPCRRPAVPCFTYQLHRPPTCLSVCKTTWPRVTLLGWLPPCNAPVFAASLYLQLPLLLFVGKPFVHRELDIGSMSTPPQLVYSYDDWV